MSPNLNTTLSVCLIVKNEANFIEDCIKSFHNIASEIIVLDTGSTDSTVEIAQKYGAKIEHFTWCDHFAKARNASIKNAAGEWILWLDADERLLPSTLQALKKELTNENKPIVYEVQINNKTKDDAQANISTAFRLFRNGQGIAFTGAIHEQLTLLNNKQVISRRSGLIIDHLGYAVDDTLSEQKNARNLKILTQLVKDEPQNAYAHYTLGQQYTINAVFDKAEHHLITALHLNQLQKAMSASLLNVLGEVMLKQKRLQQAQHYAQQSIKLMPKQVGAYYILFKIHSTSNQWEKALEAVNLMSQYSNYIKKHGWQISTDVTLNESDLLFERARIYLAQGAFKQAYEAFNKLLKIIGADEKIYNNLIHISLKMNLFDEAILHIGSLIKLNPNRNDALDTLGMIYMKQQKFNDAIQIYDLLHQKQPQDTNITRRLAGLYLKIGDEKKAAALISA